MVFLLILSVVTCSHLIDLRWSPKWTCTFTKGNCDIVNEPRMPSNFSLLPNGTLFNQTGIYYLSLSKWNIIGARLVTPYFRADNLCIEITLISFGNRRNSLQIIKQDFENKRIKEYCNKNDGFWKSYKINVKMSHYDSRFFLELRAFNHNYNETGFFAISKITFKNSYC